jgi:AraC-like DNA-binding protein
MEESHRIDLDKTNSLLIEALFRLMPKPGSFDTGIKGLWTTRRDAPSLPMRFFYDSLIIVVVQGKKHSFIGTEELVYSPKKCVFLGVDLPGEGRITEASPEKPYMALIFQLDASILSELLGRIPPGQIETSSRAEPCSKKGMAVVDVDPDVLDAFLRLAESVKSPAEQAVLAPMIIREIHYRLLMGPLGSQLKKIHTIGSQSNQVVQALHWLRDNYNKPFTIDDLAKRVNMAPSTFRRCFYQLTTISPLQYQKRLRLYEAQHLMLTEGVDANHAGYSVGYESITQFNREYKRLFGEPPKKNVKSLLTS